MNAIDDELKALAALALKNQFYRDFSALVEKYLIAGHRLGDSYENQLAETANFFSRSTHAAENSDVPGPRIVSYTAEGWSYEWSSLIAALESSYSYRVTVNGAAVFQKIGDEWNYVEEIV